MIVSIYNFLLISSILKIVRFFIDRNHEMFTIVLEYVRSGKLDTTGISQFMMDDLKSDFNFYQIVYPGYVFIFFYFVTIVLKLLQCFSGVNILSNPLHISQLASFVPHRRFKLLYIGSKDGFGAKECHDKIDHKGATSMVINSERNNIFGGYASISWGSNSGYKTDSSAFLFSLLNPKRRGNEIHTH